MKTSKIALYSIAIGIIALFVSPYANAGDWDVQPTVKMSVAPQNPSKIKGMVMATIQIDEKGHVASAKIAKSTDSALEESVLEAVKQWRFNPAQKEGNAIACQINLPFQFKI